MSGVEVTPTPPPETPTRMVLLRGFFATPPMHDILDHIRGGTVYSIDVPPGGKDAHIAFLEPASATAFLEDSTNFMKWYMEFEKPEDNITFKIEAMQHLPFEVNARGEKGDATRILRLRIEAPLPHIQQSRTGWSCVVLNNSPLKSLADSWATAGPLFEEPERDRIHNLSITPHYKGVFKGVLRVYRKYIPGSNTLHVKIEFSSIKFALEASRAVKHAGVDFLWGRDPCNKAIYVDSDPSDVDDLP